jgi:uncharacterized phage-associated protein
MADSKVSVHDAVQTKPTLFDFDAYMRQLNNAGEVARHKRLYELLCDSIAETGTPAFEARCEAWVLGPVFVELHKHPGRAGNPSALSAADRRLCKTVLAKIGHFSGRALAIRSHRRPEWQAVRKGLKPTECGHREITPEMIATNILPQLGGLTIAGTSQQGEININRAVGLMRPLGNPIVAAKVKLLLIALATNQLLQRTLTLPVLCRETTLLPDEVPPTARVLVDQGLMRLEDETVVLDIPEEQAA